jgi:Fe(3+) dicitrate transport protein
MKQALLILSILLVNLAFGQKLRLEGRVMFKNGEPVFAASVLLKNTNLQAITDEEGKFNFSGLDKGRYTLVAFFTGNKVYSKELILEDNLKLEVRLEPLQKDLKDVVIKAEKQNSIGLAKLHNVEETAIYAGKKSEVIVMEDVTGNTAANNARQVYSKVAGLNIWESDGAGIQLGIGGRGLNPNRVSNFNTRQNGYDISADALGYPESYYSPPAEAIERIEIVRGAASLQYGTQFGGFINFKLKDAPEDKKFELVSRQTGGSWGFLNSFNSIGGKLGKLKYYSFAQYKRGDGWRPNSQFETKTAFASVSYDFSEKFKIKGDYTFMNYLAQQPGGLTDVQFEQNPRQSLRERNWFSVDWNLFALHLDYKITDKLKFNNRSFGLVANRKALGFLGAINRGDPMGERDLLVDEFTNFGNESRLIFTYNTFGFPSNLLVGTRYYKGFTNRMQGFANKEKGPDFYYLNPNRLEHSHYHFPSINHSAFVENVFQLSERLSLTPGLRYEFISTNSKGYYNETYRDMGNNIIFSATIEEARSSHRQFFISGLGTSYKWYDNTELYANISQNYRSINFNDMRIVNPNFRVDPNLKDERGYSADMGIRGSKGKAIYYDASVFVLRYNDRIGSVQKLDSLTFTVYRLRTNIADSRNVGLETFVEADLWYLFVNKSSKVKLSLFSNLSILNARYLDTEELAFHDKMVEFVPELIFKSGLNFKKGNLKLCAQYSYTSSQFTDATNAVYTANAVNGIIPSYTIFDFSAEYSLKKHWAFAAGINNLANNMYFTRRAEGYPGPGIIPSDGRSFYITLQYKL